MTQESLSHNETSATVEQPDTDIAPIDNPEDAVLELLRSIADAVQRRETPAPSAFVATQFPTTVSVRLTWFVVSVTVAAAVTIRIGSAINYTFNIGAAQLTVAIPLSIELKEGTDVAVVSSAGVVSWYFLGYPE
jgi:hypothetical protein